MFDVVLTYNLEPPEIQFSFQCSIFATEVVKHNVLKIRLYCANVLHLMYTIFLHK